MKQENRRVVMVTIGIMLCFLLFGYCDAIRGASLTDVIGSFQVGYVAGGLLIAVHFAGYCASSLIFGGLAGKIEKRLLPVIANIVILAGILIYTKTEYIAVFAIGVLCIGFGLGLYEFAGNTIVADIYPEAKRGKYANLVAGMHGIGAVIGPVLFGVTVEKGGGYKTSFRIAVPVMILVIILFIAVRYPKQRYLKDEVLPVTAVIKAAGMKQARKYYILSALYIAAEAGVITWMSAFFIERGYSVSKASLWLSLFFVFLTIGRFAGSAFVDRIGYRRTLLCGFAASCICIVMGTGLPGGFAVLLPVCGIFLSVLFPTLGASLSVECKTNTSVCMGAFFAFAALGGAVGSSAVGQISEAFGVRTGLMWTAAFSAAACVIIKYTQWAPPNSGPAGGSAAKLQNNVYIYSGRKTGGGNL